jgi:hypothetical protein
MEVSMNRQAFVLLPSAHGRDMPLQIRGDLFPRIELNAGRTLPRERSNGMRLVCHWSLEPVGPFCAFVHFA